MGAQEIIRHIGSRLKALAPEAKGILYGSRARGDARIDSDYDLLILLPDDYDKTTFVRRKIDISGGMYELSLRLGIDISTLILPPKVFYARKTPFTTNVIKEGIKL